jgi:hypothetical protein
LQPGPPVRLRWKDEAHVRKCNQRGRPQREVSHRATAMKWKHRGSGRHFAIRSPLDTAKRIVPQAQAPGPRGNPATVSATSPAALAQRASSHADAYIGGIRGNKATGCAGCERIAFAQTAPEDVESSDQGSEEANKPKAHAIICGLTAPPTPRGRRPPVGHQLPAMLVETRMLPRRLIVGLAGQHGPLVSAHRCSLESGPPATVRLPRHDCLHLPRLAGRLRISPRAHADCAT